MRAFRIILFLIALAPATFGRAQVAIKNNLLYDAAMTPNLGVEFRLGEKHRWTLGMNVGYSPFELGTDTERRWRHVLVMPEARYWFCEAFARHFISINTVYSHYNAAKLDLPLYSTEDFRYQGDFVGAGASWGYDIALGKNKRWNLEFEAGADLCYTWYDQYACEHCGAELGSDQKFFVLPKLGINIAYLFPGGHLNKNRMRACDKPLELLNNIPYIAPEPKPFVPQLEDLSLVGTLDTLLRNHPVLAHISQYEPYTEDVVLRKKGGMLYVHFPINQMELRRDFRDNGKVLDEIIHVTRLILADSVVSVKKIQIIGLASIEGPFQLNCDLGDGRARALQNYVQRILPATAGMFEVNGGCEAWAEFRDQVNDLRQQQSEGITMEELDKVLDIIATQPDKNQREAQLRRLNGGRTFRYLQQNVLADQRNSGYVRIYYDYVPDPTCQRINEANQLLRDGRADEALALLQTLRGDSRADNALACALYMTGRRNEAINIWRTSNDPKAKENLRGIEN